MGRYYSEERMGNLREAVEEELFEWPHVSKRTMKRWSRTRFDKKRCLRGLIPFVRRSYETALRK